MVSAAPSPGSLVEVGIQPMMAAMPARQNKITAMPVIHISGWGCLLFCVSMLITLVVVLSRMASMLNSGGNAHETTLRRQNSTDASFIRYG